MCYDNLIKAIRTEVSNLNFYFDPQNDIPLIFKNYRQIFHGVELY